MPPPFAKPKFTKTDQILSELGNRVRRKKEPEAEEPEASNEEVWLISYSDMMTLLFGFFVILFSMSTLDKNKFDSFKKAASKEFGGEYQLPTENLKRQVDKGLSDAGLKNDDVQVTQTVEGLELNFKGQAFFLSGSAELSPAAKAFILKASESIKKTGNDYMIRIEGHTDDVPIKTANFPSNWELSSARATAVIRVLEENNINPLQMEAIGYGSSRPLKPNRDNNNTPIEKNRAENRRIVVKLRKMEPSEMQKLPPRAAPAPQASLSNPTTDAPNATLPNTLPGMPSTEVPQPSASSNAPAISAPPQNAYTSAPSNSIPVSAPSSTASNPKPEDSSPTKSGPNRSPAGSLAVPQTSIPLNK